MPYTLKTGRFYKVVNGKRQYDPRFDKAPTGASRSGANGNGRIKGPIRTRSARMPPQERTRAPPRSTNSSAAGRALLEGGGALLGGTLFGPGGAAVGGLAGGALSSFLGLGDYEIKENVFMGGRLPKMINDSPSGGTIIRHQEYLGDVITSATPNTFNLQAFGLNPADEGTHPWLAQIAANYEEYQYEGLVFQFRSTSADALNSTNTALGSVMMATNYDSADAVFASKAEMLNYEYSCSAKPSESLLHMIECAPSQTVLGHQYCRPGLPPAGTDIRFFDLGKFQIATTGFQGTSVNIGELHCTYQVRLLKPKLFASLGSDINYYHSTNFVDVKDGSPLGAPASEVVLMDNMGVTTTTTQVTLPVSRVIESYWVFYQVQNDAGPQPIVEPIITLTGANTDALINSACPAPATVSGRFNTMFRIVTLGDSTRPVITFGTAGTFPDDPCFRRLIITQNPNGLA